MQRAIIVAVLACLTIGVIGHAIDGDDNVIGSMEPTEQFIEEWNTNEPEPNCHGELGAVWKVDCKGKPACTYVQYKPLNIKQSMTRFVAQGNGACADLNAPGRRGKPSSTYMDTKSKVLYYTTGQGVNVYSINPRSGKETFFAQLPAGHEYIIGLIIAKGKLVLITTTEAWEAELKTPTVFQRVFDPNLAGVRMHEGSLAAYDPVNDVYFFTGGLLDTRVYTYSRTSGTLVAEGAILNFVDVPKAMFWSMTKKQLLVLSPTDQLAWWNPYGGDSNAQIIYQLPTGTLSSTVNVNDKGYATTMFYAANFQNSTSVDLGTCKDLKCSILQSPINGTNILGPWAYIV